MPFKRPLGAVESAQQATPHFVRPLQDRRVIVGANVLLECIVEGVPQPAIKWLKDNQNVTQCPDYEVTSDGSRCELRIPSASAADGGRFTCQALNAAGSKSSTCTLIVAPAPSPYPGKAGQADVPPSPAPPATPVGPAAPIFLKDLQPQPLKVGGTAVLECRVGGNPPPDVAWYKNGLPIDGGFRYKVDNDTTGSGICSVTISMMFAEDVADYVCKATNQHGSAETTAQVMHKEKYDDWLSEQQRKITKEKKQFMMSDLEKAIQRPRGQQARTAKGAVASSRTQRMLEQQIATGMASDADSSTDVPWVSESETEPELAAIGDERSAPPSAPVFRSHLRSLRVGEGNDAILQASLTGTPKPKVFWYKNGQALTPAAGNRFQFTYRGSMVVLKIKMAFKEDSGRYTLVAENAHGKATSEADMEVLSFGDGGQPSQGQTANPQTAYGNPVAKQQQQQSPPKPAQKQAPPGQWRDATGPSAAVPVVGYRTPGRGDDVGTGQPTQPQHGQRAHNPGAHQAHQHHNPGPQQQQQRPWGNPHPPPPPQHVPSNNPGSRPPQFIQMPLSHSVKMGDTAKFEAKIAAMPAPRVEWVRLSDNAALDNSPKYAVTANPQEGHYTLQVRNCDANDVDQYCIIARNDGGQVQARCQLDILSPVPVARPPHLVEKFESVTVKESDSLTLFCKATGENVVMQWFKDDVPLVPGKCPYKIETKPTESTLQIINAKPNDAGWYQCDASNVSGTTSLRGRVSVIAKDAPGAGGFTRQRPSAAVGRPPSPSLPFMPAKRDAAPEQYTAGGDPMVRVSTQYTDQFHMYQQQQMLSTQYTEKPRFTAPVQAQRVVEGAAALFECTFAPASDPTLKVVWLHNERPIDASSRISAEWDIGHAVLHIEPVAAHDAGTYTCLVVNAGGDARTSAELLVDAHTPMMPRRGADADGQYNMDAIRALEQRRMHARQAAPPSGYDEMMSVEMPKFLNELKDINVADGKQAHFEAKLGPANDPNMEIFWLKDGMPLQMGSRLRILHDFGYVALDILHTIPEDAGVYTCRAENPLGMAETHSNLAVATRHAASEADGYVASYDKFDHDPGNFARSPAFVQQLKDCETKEFGRAHIEARCVPQGDSGLRVEWLKDGRPLKSANRITCFQDFGFVSLTIYPAYPEDSAIYTCVLGNRMGQAESKAKVIVYPKHTLITESSHDEALAQIRQLDNRRLRIGPEDVTRPEELHSVNAPRFSRPLPELFEVAEAQSVHFECRVLPANDPRMHVEWLFNGQPMPAGHRFKPMFDFGYVALDILYAYPEDSGVYTAVARNQIGEQSCQTQLVVTSKQSLYTDAQHPDGLQRIERLEQLRQARARGADTEHGAAQCPHAPKLAGKLRDHSLREGHNLHLELKVEPVHDGTMRIEWQRNGRPLGLGSRIRTAVDFGFCTLDVYGVIPEDEGVYSLVAVNALGDATMQCNVEVAAGSGIVGGTIHQDTMAKITQLEGRHKYARPEATDYVPNEPPSFVRPMRSGTLSLYEGQNMHLECELRPVGDPGMRIHWLRDGKPIPAGHRVKTFSDFGFVSLDVTGLHPDDSGVYSCVAQNALGQTAAECELVCLGKSAIIGTTQHPESLQRITALETPRHRPQQEEELAIGAPEFVKPLLDPGDVPDGGNVHLQCQVRPTNDPDLKVEWFVNQVPIQTGHRFQTQHDFGHCALNILYMYPEDSGVYTCVARNKHGEAFTQVRVDCRSLGTKHTDTMHPHSLHRIEQLEAARSRPRAAQHAEEADRQAPKFVVRLPDKLDNLKEAQTVHLECQVTPVDDPNLAVQWFRDDEPLRASHRFAMTHDFGYVALDILHVYPEDTGCFSVRAANQLGEAVSKCHVHCIQRKEIYTETQHPESWRRIRELEMRKPVRGTEPERERTAPIFTEQLKCPTQVKEGQSVHMECILQPIDDPDIQIEWLVNGQPLMMGSRLRTMHDFGYVAMEIYHVHPEDSGVYVCRATNALGTAETSAEMNCIAKQSLYLDTQHEQSWRQIQALEGGRRGDKEPSPDQRFPPPTFTKPLQSVDNLHEGQAVRLQCSLEPFNDPSLRVTWYRNGQPLPLGSRFMPARDFDLVSLDMLTVYPEDSGVYSCVAKSAFGEATASCTVKCQGSGAILGSAMHPESWRQVQALESRHGAAQPITQPEMPQPPVVIVPLPVDLGQVPEGAPVHLECQVQPITDPRLHVQWYHSGKPIVNAHRFKVTHDFGYCALDLLYVFPEDQGEWTCKAKNDLGEAETTTRFEIVSKKVIDSSTQHPASWDKIRQMETPQRAAPAEAERVKQPPRFTGEVAHLERIEGQPAHFETRVAPIDDEALTVSWFKDGKPLVQANRVRTTCDFGYVALDLTYTNVEDTGAYTCVARNHLGEAKIDATLNVIERGALQLEAMHPASWQKIQQLESKPGAAVPDAAAKPEPPVFTKQLNSCTDLIEGQPGHFEATVKPVNDPNLKITWFLNGQPITAGSRRTMRHDFGLCTLDLSYVLPEDIGMVVCVAQNDVGRAETTGELSCVARSSIVQDTMHAQSWAKIQQLEAPKPGEVAPSAAVQQKPSFTQPLVSLPEMMEGQEAIMNARVIPVNDPKLRLEWYHDGQPLVQANRIAMTDDFGFVQLKITGLGARDAGMYMCRAVNELGEAVTTAEIGVKTGSTILGAPQHPEALKKVAELEAMDKLGKAPMPEKEYVRPTFVKQLVDLDDVDDGGVVQLECVYEPKDDPRLVIDWLVNGQPLVSANRHALINEFGHCALHINGALAKDSALYTCRARNAHGEATTSCTLKVKGYRSILLDSSHPLSWQKIQQLEFRAPAEEAAEPSPEAVKPFFTSGVQNVETSAEGQPIQLEATFEPSKDQRLRVQWFRNNEPIMASQLFKTRYEMGRSTLVIDKAYANHSGLYTITIMNDHGEASTSCTVKIAGAGDVVGQPMHAQTLRRIAEMEAGKAPRQLEPAEAAKQPPVIVRQLTDISVVEYGTIVLDCEITPKHDLDMQYQWQRNGHTVETGNRITAKHEFGKCTMTIHKATDSDAGVYTMSASNALGNATTSATVKVASTGVIVSDTTHQQSVAKIAELEAPKAEQAGMQEAPLIKPHIVQPLGELAPLKEGQSLHLAATVEPVSDATLKADWLHNGTPIQASNRLKVISDFGWHILDIASVRSSDAGDWSLRVHNAAGEAATATRLDVHGSLAIDTHTTRPTTVAKIHGLEAPKAGEPEADAAPHGPPRFVKELAGNEQCDEGDTVHIEGQVTPATDPTLRIDWLKDGKPMKSGSRFKTISDFGFVVFEIHGALQEDNGTYTCVATTATGEAQSSFTLNCTGKPGLITKPQVGAGKQQAITSLEEQLHRPRAEPEAKALSKAAPVFVEPLRNGNNLRDGDTANFYCRFTPVDDPTVRIEWYVNGRPVVTGSRVRTVNEFGVAMLEISPVYEQDSGEYVCRAVNAYGEASTSVAMRCQPAGGIVRDSQLPQRMAGAGDKIKLIEAQRPQPAEQADRAYGPPHFVKELQDLHDLVHGQLAHLECQVQPVGDPYLEIEWFHNGQPISHSNRIRMISDFGFVILELAPCNPIDSGEWICRARNREGAAETRCSVGDVKPQSGVSYEWLRPPDKRDKINELESWLARPKEGALPADLDFPPPKIVHPISDLVDLVEGAQAAFQCQIEPQGDSTLHIEWLHNGSPIPFSSRMQMHHSFGFAVLDISYTIPEDSGEYMCRVTNAKGMAETKAKLSCMSAQEAEAPVIVQPLISSIEQVREGDAVHMECRVGPINDPKLTVTWYLNGKPLQLGSRHKTMFDFGFAALDMTNITSKEDEGIYTCRATNARGQAQTECKVTVAAGAGLVFERQVPVRTGADLTRYLAQYTKKEIVLTIEDVYKDGDARPPVFKDAIQNIAVDEGSFTRFEGQLAPVNDPYMKVEWFHNGEPIMIGQRFRSVLERGWVALDLHYALPTDTGEFTCVATNKHGTAKCSAMLACTPKKHVITGTQVPQGLRIADVRENEDELYWSQDVDQGEQPKLRKPPLFTIPPRNAQVKEAEPARFECALTGFPRPKVHWFHNGGLVVASARYRTSFDGMYFMTVNSCRPSDAGEIVVVAKNLLGEAQMRASLDVLQTTEFVNFRLRPARPPTEAEQANRELQWQQESLGDLGDHFSKQSKPAVHTLYKLERERPSGDTDEATDELKYKFSHKREDEFYERLQQVEKERPSVEPIPFDWGTKLKPSAVQQSDMPREGLPSVQLKPVKPKEAAPEPEVDPGWLKSIEKKLSKEERAKRYKQREAAPKETEVAPKEKVALKTAKPSPVAGPKELPASTIDATKRRAKIPQAAAAEEPTVDEEQKERTKSKERLKKGAFQLREPAVVEPTMLDTPEMKQTPEYQIKTEQAEEAHSTKVEQQQRVFEHGGKRMKVQETKTLHRVHKEAEQFVGDKPADTLTGARAVQSHVQPANVVQQLTPQHVEVGRNAKFVCTYEGAPPVTVHWYKDGKPLSSSVDHQIHTTETATSLSIPRVKEWHGGEYACRVQNAGGATQSTTNLQVLPRRDVGDAPYFKRVLEETHVSSGRPVQLDAVVHAKPTANVHWFKDGAAVPSDVRFKMLADGELHSLLIIEAMPYDSGRYECVASNERGEARCAAKLTVELSQSRPPSPPKTPQSVRKAAAAGAAAPPRITQQLKPQLTQQGRGATFTCTYTGQPEPAITWYFDGQPIKKSKFFKISQADGTATLDIKEAYAEDVGKYRVELVNATGKAASAANLAFGMAAGPSHETKTEDGRTVTKITKTMSKTVQSGSAQDSAPSDGSPGFKVPLASEQLRPGHKVVLKAEVVGEPLPSAEWQHNKQTIDAADRERKIVMRGRQASLEIGYAKPAHAGEYRLLLSNDKGTAACSAYLSMQE